MNLVRLSLSPLKRGFGIFALQPTGSRPWLLSFAAARLAGTFANALTLNDNKITSHRIQMKPTKI